jgi:hypothetical protein
MHEEIEKTTKNAATNNKIVFVKFFTAHLQETNKSMISLNSARLKNKDNEKTILFDQKISR